MARVTFDPGIRGYRGTAGNQVFKRHRGETIVTRKPDMSGVVRSEAQKAFNSRFAGAIEYAKRAMDDPDLGPIYREAARRTEGVAFRVAVSDFMRPPVVKDIDLSAYAGASGDVITIEAVDEWHVAAVTVRLTDAASAAASRRTFRRVGRSARRRGSDGCVSTKPAAAACTRSRPVLPAKCRTSSPRPVGVREAILFPVT